MRVSGEFPGPAPSAELRADIPHPARVYDYLLGGKDNFPVDRAAAERLLAAEPEVRSVAVANRAFMQRAVRYAAEELGVRQFLDIGTGIPTAGHTHEIAQAVEPAARVLYVDNDPIVPVHARALPAAAERGRLGVLQADLRDPEKILAAEELARVIDLGRPVALVLCAVLHFVEDEAQPRRIVERLLRPLARGSVIVLSHGVRDGPDGEPRSAAAAVADEIYRPSTGGVHPRTPTEVLALLAGCVPVAPGLVPVGKWRPDLAPTPTSPLPLHGVLAVKR